MKRRAAGFTLLEVLLATALLAAAMALAFATVRAAGATIERGEAIAARNERIRAVSAFLRQRIGGARGIVFELDPATGQAKRFQGEARRMRFVSDLPGYLGRGGPHLHELQVSADGRLQVAFHMVLAGRTVVDRKDRPPEPLATGLQRVEFAYRTTGKDGGPGEWNPLWRDPQGLPLQVRVRIRDALGPWPDLVVELPMAASDGVGDGL